MRPSMMTRMWLLSWVGPQWSVYSLDHGSSGALLGFRGSLALLSTLTWHARQVLTLLSTALSMPGNHSLTFSCLLVVSMPWFALGPRSMTQSLTATSFIERLHSGMTILSPLQTSSLITPSSSQTAM